MRLYVIAPTLAALAVIGLFATGFSRVDPQREPSPSQEGESSGRITLTTARRTAAGIEVESTSRTTMPVLVRTTGNVEPNTDRLAHVAPPSGGIVEAVTEEGHLGVHVEPGTTLAVLHSTSVGKDQSAFLKARSLVALCEKTCAREEELHKKNVTSGKELLDAEAARQQARIELQAARSRLRILGFSQEEIERLAKGESEPDGRMLIVSPIEGAVIDKHVVRGEFVPAERALFTVADLHRLWVQTHIYERDLARIKAGQKAEVSVAAYPDVRFEGTIAYLGDVMDDRTRTVKARVVVDDDTHRIKPGMFATVAIEVARRENVLAVPESAVQSYQGAEVVFVEEESNVFEIRRVRTGVRFGGAVEITAGLKESEKVVRTGAFLLKSELLKETFGHDHD